MGGPGSGRRRGTRSKAVADRDAEIVRLRQQGLTLTEIAGRSGVKRQTVAAALKRTGFESGSRPRGFAAIPPGRQREIASLGGKAAQARGTAHRFDSEEVAAAGRKGGKTTQGRGTGRRFIGKEARAAG
jgi:general stress protein YciG